MNAPVQVSCIMPTADRRRFVAQSITYFLRQDYPHCELVILDDGRNPVADLVPRDRRVRYIRHDKRLPVGAKRNLACEHSRGDVIVHWDDDDWMSPRRISAQVGALERTDAAVCGLGEVLHYRPTTAEAWLFHSSAPGSVAGCSLAYRRSLWEQRPFATVDVGEDTAFVNGLEPAMVHALVDRSLLIALIHPSNTSPKRLDGPEWRAHPIGDVAALLHTDRHFYAQLRTQLRVRATPPAADVQPATPAPAPAPAPTGGRMPTAAPSDRALPLVATPATATGRPAERPPVVVAADFEVHSGYGSMAEYLALGMVRAGADVHLAPLSVTPTGLSEEFLALLDERRDPDPAEPVVYHSWLRTDFERFRHAPNLFVYTMWEADPFPVEWIPSLDATRAVIVPSSFVADCLHRGGVTAPIEVVPEGIDPEVYRFEPRPQRAGLTSLIVGPVDGRKHTLLAIAAWKEAFAGDADARLIIKSSYGYGNYRPDDHRITYVDSIEQTRGIARWYRQADLLLALGNEGFGLPLVEAMATGLPVVALATEGQADVCRQAPDLVLAVPAAGHELHHHPAVTTRGRRSIPDVEVVVRHLRWIDAHRDEARAMGRAAATWVSTHRNVWQLGPGVLDVVTDRSRPSRPAAARPRLWAPSVGTPCGVGEYSGTLAAHLPSATITASPGEHRSADPATAADPGAVTSASLVHVQHEPGLISDHDITRVIHRARRDGTPVVVTEHSIWPAGSAWEEEVDALVALTTSGASRLRARRPAVRVEHIPLGCATWFPPRKRRRGRVIGVFGFPGPHKGLRALGRALEDVEAEVLLHTYVPPGYELPRVRWPRPAAVRWETTYRPIDEVAGRLAAEADILLFWYDQLDLVAASSAVLVGLATGVPVLTSPTTWFEDLGGAVHRSTDLASGIERLLADDALRERVTGEAREHCERHRWSRIAVRHVELWRSLTES